MSEIEQKYLRDTALEPKVEERVSRKIICSQYIGHVKPAHARLSGH